MMADTETLAPVGIDFASPSGVLTASNEIPRIGQDFELVKTQDGNPRPFSAVWGSGPYPHMLVDDGHLEAVFNLETLNACGVDVDECLSQHDGHLLHISAHTIEFWDWLPDCK